MERDKYDWLEFSYRPLKDGLHDSGYRYIKVVGVTMTADGVEEEELHQWADHVLLNGITNIDVTKDGTIRLMCYIGQGGWREQMRGFHGSDAMFAANNLDETVRQLEMEKEIHAEVYDK